MRSPWGDGLMDVFDAVVPEIRFVSICDAGDLSQDEDIAASLVIGKRDLEQGTFRVAFLAENRQTTGGDVDGFYHFLFRFPALEAGGHLNRQAAMFSQVGAGTRSGSRGNGPFRLGRPPLPLRPSLA